ncbi:MAG: class I SAM-dependent methyltransferase [Aestuariivirga sp.]
MREWSGPFISHAIDLKGRAILDLRGRSGALAEFMARAGAKVLHTDPFQANVDFAATKRKLHSKLLKLTEVIVLADWTDQRFDAVTALSVHLLAHVPSPVAVLGSIQSILKPGGIFVFDEKDVASPVRYKNGSIYSSGSAHLHHFTTETLGKCIAAAGFELVLCEIDKSHATAFRHIKAIARKPKTGEKPRQKDENNSGAAQILSRLKKAERGKWAFLIKRKLGIQ